MRLGLTQSPRLEQRLIQSPQLIQAMKVLQLPLIDLQGRIEQELLENPFLEVAEPAPEDVNGVAAPPRPAAPASETPAGPLADWESKAIQTLEAFERLAGERSPRRPRGSDEDAERKAEALANTPRLARNVAELLMPQIGFLELDEKEHAIAEYLVSSLDPRGYLRTPIEEIALDPDLATTPEQVSAVIEKLRPLGPPGL